jgi:UPF0755 protein
MTRLKWSLGLLGAGSVASVLALAYLVVLYPSRTPPPRAAKTVAITLAQDSTLRDVTTQLAGAGLISQPRVFELYARALGASQRLKVGRVLVTSQMTPRQLLQRVASGYGSTPLLITVPEGWNRFDVANRLAEWGVCSREDFLRAEDRAVPLGANDENALPGGEGFLFPDTYWLRDGMPAEHVVARLLENARRHYGALLESDAAAFAELRREFGFGLREVVILASIVEKEAHAPSEQPVIAGVFLNRLRDPNFRPKRLQADPTVAYGCLRAPTLASCVGFDGKRVNRTMTADPQNIYNTYRFDGLPPAPIANPGLSAVRAVLLPARHDFLYFVARGDGRHAFSSTLEAHNLAVQKLPMPH